MSTKHETPVLIVGAGPAGLIAALQLSTNNVPCILIERNLETTKWPKMDITNPRSMEILRRLGVAQGLRDVGVPGNYSFDVNFSNGLSDGGELIAKWQLSSPNEWRTRIKEQNDGSMPREPYQRCSQAIFEAWLKPKIQAETNITSIFGWKLTSLVENDSNVECEVVDQSGETHTVVAQYVIGCDGAGSRVRRSIDIPLTGGPVPGAMYLVHFKSRDLSRLQRQGQFWHIFFTSGSAIIAQDEKDTWTVHYPIPIDFDVSTLDPTEIVYKVLGGALEPFPIEIDEILVTSNWRPNICLADRYMSEKGRVFLSGDAAHQNIPTGGYGMNTAVGDSFDLGWKIAAAVKGYGGKALMQSYEEERRPVAAKNIDQSGLHWMIHAKVWEWCMGKDIVSQSEDAKSLRARIQKHVSANDAENKAHGLELGYRYSNSSVVNHELDGSKEPEWSLFDYVPSTWPGVRAPHVFLKDGATNIFDHFGAGQEYTLVDFTSDGSYMTKFIPVAQALGVPVKYVHLTDESHARKVWERDAVLVRPDDHVAWRAPSALEQSDLDVENILLIAVGQRRSRKLATPNSGYFAGLVTPERSFAGTVGNVDQNNVELLGAFQK